MPVGDVKNIVLPSPKNVTVAGGLYAGPLDAAIPDGVVELDPDTLWRLRLVAFGRARPRGCLGAGPADPQDRLVSHEVVLQRPEVAVQVAEAIEDVALCALEFGRETQVRVLQEAHLVTPREVRVDRGRSSLQQRPCQAKTSWRRVR